MDWIESPGNLLLRSSGFGTVSFENRDEHLVVRDIKRALILCILCIHISAVRDEELDGFDPLVVGIVLAGADGMMKCGPSGPIASVD